MTSKSLGSIAALASVTAFGWLDLACSDRGATGASDPLGASPRVVGTPASMLREASRAGLHPARGRLALPTTLGASIDLIAEDFQLSGDYLSMTGTARDAQNSSFILKGDGKEMYGWVVLHDQDLAYEYTTSSQGELQVAQVPVTDIFPVCDPDPDPETDGAHFDDTQSADMLPAGPAHVGAYDGRDTLKLQSNPGAAKVLFMDIAPLTLAKDQLWRAWQTVAASFSAFEVNVTTDPAVFAAAEPRNRGKACSRNEAGRSSCGLNAFGTTRCCNVFNKGNGYYQGTTTAHELGHLMGLRHDGAPGAEYFRGLPGFKWCPIMGANTPKTTWLQDALFQWSKGEYTGASNKEDDLAIISKNLPFKKDDIPTSKPLVIRGAEVSAADNRGLIETNTDSDMFTFTVGAGGGRTMLTVDRLEFVGGAYLDVEAQIQTAGGMMLARSNEMVSRKAVLDVMLPAGTYNLIVKGGAEGTPMNGFSSYSSLGYYGISGTINAATGGGPGVDAGPAMDGGGGAPDAGGGQDAGARDTGSGTADATAPASDGGGIDSGSGGATGGTGGSGGSTGTGGRGGTRGAGGAAGTGNSPPPTETSRGPVYGGCAVSPGGGTPAPAGTALLLLAAVVVGARRRRR